MENSHPIELLVLAGVLGFLISLFLLFSGLLCWYYFFIQPRRTTRTKSKGSKGSHYTKLTDTNGNDSQIYPMEAAHPAANQSETSLEDTRISQEDTRISVDSSRTSPTASTTTMPTRTLPTTTQPVAPPIKSLPPPPTASIPFTAAIGSILNHTTKETQRRGSLGSQDSLGSTPLPPLSPPLPTQKLYNLKHGQQNGQHQPSLVKHIAIKEYAPTKKDHMPLAVNDIIIISMAFTDGWAYGTQISALPAPDSKSDQTATQVSGMFPLSHVELYEQESQSDSHSHESINSISPIDESGQKIVRKSEYPPLAESGKGKLLFSMLPPKKALEIITDMTLETRSTYFKTLISPSQSLSSQISSPSPSIQDLTQDGKTIDTTPSDPTVHIPVIERRGQKNWMRLREKWKEAVEVELEEGYERWEARRKRSNFWKMLAENYRV